jgi:hypothetical protein
MSKVVAIMSMSLDGYVADLNDGVAEVFDWYTSSGDVEIRIGGTDPMTFHVSQPSANHLHGLISELGAMISAPTTSPAGGHVPARLCTSSPTVSNPLSTKPKLQLAGSPLESTAQTPFSNTSTLDSSTKSTSTSRRFFLAPEFDSSTASPARQSSLATRR